MLFSFNLLKKLSKAPKNWSVEEMTIAFNKLGFEVEQHEPFIDAEGVKYGKIISVSKNPEGDKLNVCQIQFEDKIRTIQTTDNSVIGNEGKVVMAFVPGSRLGEMIFSNRKMKGIDSEGMLCAYEELVKNSTKDLLPAEWKGKLQIFDENTDLSSDPLETQGFNDHIIEIDILSNRSDSNSYLVMAQELKAYLDIEESPKFANIIEGSFETTINVENGEADLLTMAETKVEGIELSLEEKLILLKSDIKLISPIVDMTNLTLLMTGQPVHVYDKKSISGNITAKTMDSKSIILGGTEINFEDALLIKDENKAISAAGVMGFEETGVNNSTQDVIIEVGNFNIKKVRHTAKQTKLNSLSSRQSSKRLGIGTQELAWTYLTNRLPNISKVKNLGKYEQKVIGFNKKEIDKLIGHEISNVDFVKLCKKMNTLGFTVNQSTITIPNYRHDIEAQQDINEEFIRLFGYDNLEPSAPFVNPSYVQFVQHKHSDIAAMGYQEVWTYSLISKEKNIFNPFSFEKTIELETFVSKEREVIRNSMAISLLGVIEYNSKRKMDKLSIFDIGRINNGVHVAAIASTIKSFTEIKQDIINIIKKPVTFVRAKGETFHEGVSAFIQYEGKTIGWIGKIHPSINSIDAFIAEVQIDSEVEQVSFKEYDENQLKSRNITFELEEKEEISKYSSKIENIQGIFSVEVSDIYIKDNIKKVTLLIKGDNKSIEIFDKNFN
ncbi:phenylalanine--tRNA ligase subunit beta [Mycoplasma marinum]|uniref:Phenylalanine--tRNA ligase beta subunit n=1 Tax=Mycoplasma marinum TaxID=1937190 RepID=A0A4R0XVP7_9MOLU|nr:phenylalanine--tRNA ligase subunit beta [Mycoplasma marinum]TCG11855.1 phenylalanine--tRNA ligase subunit beta [Mycoplasma marinum]